MGGDVADLISWGSLFRTEAAATTKARSPIVERRVAGMASEDDAAERRCLQPGTLATRLTSADVTRSSPVDALEHQCRQFESDPLRDPKPIELA